MTAAHGAVRDPARWSVARHEPRRRKALVRECDGTREDGLVKPFLAVTVLLVAALGIAGVVLGEADDSPGLQGLGGLLVIGAVVVGVRTVRRAR